MSTVSWLKSRAWMCPLLLLLFPLCTAAQELKCKSDAACRQNCQGLINDVECPLVCDLRFPRCACGDGAALRMDGLCMDLKESSPEYPCKVPTHAALFNTALWGSPELLPEDLKSGSPSLAFASILRSSLAAALTQPVKDITVAAAAIGLDRHVQNMSLGGLRQFDLALDFCAPGHTSPINLHDFERRFSREAGEYAAFRLGTIRLLSLDYPAVTSTRQLVSTTTAVLQERPNVVIRMRGARASSDLEEPGESEESSGLWTLFLFGIIGTSMAIVFFGVIVHTFQRRPSKVFRLAHSRCTDSLDTVKKGIEAAKPALPTSSGMFVCVMHAISALEIQEWSAIARNGKGDSMFLLVEDDDVVEVLAGGAGWYYGHVVGLPEESGGYFPESRVKSWLTRPPSAHLASHPLAAPVSAPTPSSVLAPHPGLLMSNSHAGGHLRQQLGASPPQTPPLPATPLSTPPPTPGRQDFRASVNMADSPPSHAVNGDDSAAVDQTVPAPPVSSHWTEPEPPSDEPPSLQRTHVCVAHAFSPREVEDEHFRSSLLALDEGDVVEVAAGGSGWLYGQLLGTDGYQGYFPEDRAASWISRPEASCET